MARPRFFPPRLPGADPLDIIQEIAGISPPDPPPSGRRPRRAHKLPEGPPGELGLILTPKSQRPTWLAPHWAPFAAATRQAAEETRHLTGMARVHAMNAIQSKLLKRK